MTTLWVRLFEEKVHHQTHPNVYWCGCRDPVSNNTNNRIANTTRVPSFLRWFYRYVFMHGDHRGPRRIDVACRWHRGWMSPRIRHTEERRVGCMGPVQEIRSPPGKRGICTDTTAFTHRHPEERLLIRGLLWTPDPRCRRPPGMLLGQMCATPCHVIAYHETLDVGSVGIPKLSQTPIRVGSKIYTVMCIVGM